MQPYTGAFILFLSCVAVGLGQSIGNTELLRAYEAAFVSSVLSGTYSNAFSQVGNNFYPGDCIPQLSYYVYPTPTAGGTLRKVVSTGNLIMGTIKTTRALDAAVDALLPSIATVMTASYGRNIHIQLINFPTLQALFTALATGAIHMTAPIMEPTSVFNGVRASTLFQTSCMSTFSMSNLYMTMNDTRTYTDLEGGGFNIGALGEVSAFTVDALLQNNNVTTYYDGAVAVDALWAGRLDAVIGTLNASESMGLHELMSHQGEPRVAFVRQDNLTCPTPLPPPGTTKGNEELALAYEAGMMRVMDRGIYQNIWSSVSFFGDVVMGDCIPDLSYYPFPTPTPGGLLARVLAAGVINIAAGSVLDDTETRLQLNLTANIIAIIAEQYNTTLIANQLVCGASQDCLDGLYSGLYDMAFGNFGLGGFYTFNGVGVRRKSMFRAGCTSDGALGLFNVQLTSNISSVEELMQESDQKFATTGEGSRQLYAALLPNFEVIDYEEEEDCVSALLNGEVVAMAGCYPSDNQTALVKSFYGLSVDIGAPFFRKDYACAYCDLPPAPANGTVVCQQQLGGTCLYTCASNFTLTGSDVGRTCIGNLSNAYYNGTAPICVPPAVIDVPPAIMVVTPPADAGDKSLPQYVIILASLGAVLMVVLLLLLLYVQRKLAAAKQRARDKGDGTVRLDFTGSDARSKRVEELLKHRSTKQIGDGATSVVYKGELDGRIVAIKVLKKTSEQAVVDFHRETNIFTRLAGDGHLNVLALVTFCDTPPALITELAEGGNFLKILRRHSQTDEKRYDFLTQIAKGMCFLHARSIVHLDLKPENILCAENDVLKISDFGTCRICGEDKEIDKDGYGVVNDFVGTLRYTPPERLTKGAKINYFAADMFSFGVICWSALEDKQPFGDKNSTYIMNMHLSSAFLQREHMALTRNYSMSVAALIENALSLNYRSRPLFAEAVPVLAAASAEASIQSSRYQNPLYNSQKKDDDNHEAALDSGEMFVLPSALHSRASMASLGNASDDKSKNRRAASERPAQSSGSETPDDRPRAKTTYSGTPSPKSAPSRPPEEVNEMFNLAPDQQREAVKRESSNIV